MAETAPALTPIDLPGAAARMRAWLFDAALPLWAERGLDSVHGGFVERLSADGAPDLDAVRRVRVQARQIYVYSHAAVLGWDGPAEDIVERGYEFLTHRGWRAEGGWAHLLTAQGAVLDGSRDAYDHAFALLAMAWAHRALRRHDPLTWATRTLDFMDAELLDDPDAQPWRGYLEGLPAKTPRRQNPHMHLLEAFLALYEATDDRRYLDRARRIVDLFRRRFFDEEQGVLYEFFDADWRRLGGEAGRVLEPGHHYEWVWLLHRYAQYSGDLTGEYAERLFDFAEAHRLGDFGFALDAVRDDGEAAKMTRRCWPQTEALRACLAMKESGRRDVDARIAELIEGLFADYLNVEPAGCWIDRFTADGEPIKSHVPASTFYHLFGAFAEALRVLER